MQTCWRYFHFYSRIFDFKKRRFTQLRSIDLYWKEKNWDWDTSPDHFYRLTERSVQQHEICMYNGLNHINSLTTLIISPASFAPNGWQNADRGHRTSWTSQFKIKSLSTFLQIFLSLRRPVDFMRRLSVSVTWMRSNVVSVCQEFWGIARLVTAKSDR